MIKIYLDLFPHLESVTPMPLYEKSHVNHDKHLCSLVEEGVDLEDYKELVRNPRYICRVCGRAAASEKNLCDPVPL